MPAPKTPRGIRNNNPGNIDFSPSTRWHGLADPPTDGRFCRFVSPVFGIRALAKLLLTYQRKHQLHTIRQILGRYAPPVENNTDAYVRAVAQRCGVSPDARIDASEYAVLEPLVRAIITHENGVDPYPPDVVRQGLAMAGAKGVPA